MEFMKHPMATSTCVCNDDGVGGLVHQLHNLFHNGIFGFGVILGDVQVKRLGERGTVDEAHGDIGWETDVDRTGSHPTSYNQLVMRFVKQSDEL